MRHAMSADHAGIGGMQRIADDAIRKLERGGVGNAGPPKILFDDGAVALVLLETTGQRLVRGLLR